MGIIATNRWSCVLDSFAFVIGADSEDLIDLIGHRGVNKGFHTQELIDILVSAGYSVTEIQRYPGSIHPETREKRLLDFKDISLENRFAEHLKNSDGVLLGYTQSNKPHATAWLKNKVHDPSTGQSYELLKRNCEGYSEGINPAYTFKPTKFLRISRIT